MKIILTLLILIPTLCFGQNENYDGLWKGYAVQDLDGNEINYKRQDFLKFKANFILLLQLQELMSMKTGEITILSKVDTIAIGETNLEGNTPLSLREESLSLRKNGENELQIVYPEFVLTFKKIVDLKEATFSVRKFEEFIVGSTLVEIDPLSNKVVGNLSKTYQDNEKVKYQKLDARSNWESAYQIVNFEGHTFLKGITSAPIILTSIENEQLFGLEADYRHDPKVISLIKLSKLEESMKKKPSTDLPFEIRITKTSTEHCIKGLSDSQLNQEVNLAQGILDKQYLTIQFQHSYDCGWLFFHDEKFDGFAKTTVKELLKIDPSICDIIEIPCAYYAERKTKDDEWYVYLHEERIETDSSYIFKKAFRWDNTYRVINEMKNQDLVHYQYYYLDTRVIRKTWSFLNGKEIGLTRFYDINGKLEKEIDNDK